MVLAGRARIIFFPVEKVAKKHTALPPIGLRLDGPLKLLHAAGGLSHFGVEPRQLPAGFAVLGEEPQRGLVSLEGFGVLPTSGVDIAQFP